MKQDLDGQDKILNEDEIINLDVLQPFFPGDNYKPLTVHFDESGSRYIRFVNWSQFTLTAARNHEDALQVNPALKRLRFLNHDQINDRFMILTHFGVNNLNAENMHPTGNGLGPKLFIHDAWGEYVILGEYLTLGTGLHYYNGLSRITNAGTINFMTFDNYRQAWSQLGLSDQFGRHLGVFAKGRIGRLNYHMAINDPIVNSIDLPGFTGEPGTTAYVGRKFFPEKASRIVQGYFDFQFLDKESNKLPFRAGSYLGKQKVFNVGLGFFSHPNGVVHINSDSVVVNENVRHLALDVFYDAPTSNGGAISVYAAIFNFDYGTNYYREGLYGTGNSFYAQAGYLIPRFNKALDFMPYMSFSNRNYDVYNQQGNSINTGVNFFINGHHAKITIEYQSVQSGFDEIRPGRNNQLILQTMIFL
ncbi:MAG: hypothetical protein ACFCUU_13375 [Cyclobacteriaceae bacterium]